MSLTVFKCLFGSDNLKRLAVLTEQRAQSKTNDCSNCEGIVLLVRPPILSVEMIRGILCQVKSVFMRQRDTE
jgi:hypothetical protein